MRILHTADWHLGKTFRGQSLLDDQKHALEQVFATLQKTNADVLIIAGDIFDRATPSNQAVALYNDFIAKVFAETTASIVSIAGNHDSGNLLGLNETLFDTSRVLIRGVLFAEERVLILEDQFGPVAFSALPYGEIYAARQIFMDETIKTPEDVLRVEVAAAKKMVPEGTRWIITAHAFVTGGKTSDTERALPVVGGVETVSSSLFYGASYVALGHLHRPQTVGSDTIRYSGAPLAFGFDEVGNDKSMTLVDLGANDVENIEIIPFSPLRQVREVKGQLIDLENAAREEPSEDYIKAILTDEGGLIDPMPRLRRFYPNILMIERVKKPDLVRSGNGRAESKLSDPIGVTSEFVNFVTKRPMSKVETKLLESILAEPTIVEV